MKRCKQCSGEMPDSDWLICTACETRNIDYRRQCDAYAHQVRQEYSLRPPSRMMPSELRRPSEMRGRKSRSAKIAAETWEDNDE